MKSRATWGLLVLTAIGLIVFLLPKDGSEAPSGETSPRAIRADRPSVDQEGSPLGEWVDSLQNPPHRAVIQQGDGTKNVVEGLGKLTHEEMTVQMARADELIGQHERKLKLCLRKEERSGDISDALESARAVYQLEQARASKVAVQTHSYVLATPESFRVPNREDLAYVLRRIPRGDDFVELAILMDYDDHPALASASKYLETTTAVYAQELAAEFNAFSYYERQSLVQRKRGGSSLSRRGELYFKYLRIDPQSLLASPK